MVLKLQAREIPQPDPGKALVKVASTAINLGDVKNGSGHFVVGVDSMGLRGEGITALMDQMCTGFEEGVLQPPALQS